MSLNHPALLEEELTSTTSRSAFESATSSDFRGRSPEQNSERQRSSGYQLGTFIGFNGKGRPLVLLGSSPQPLEAKHTCDLQPSHAGSEVVVLLVNQEIEKPVILGIVQPPRSAESANSDLPSAQVSLDGEQVTLSATKEIVLRCGKASITLTRAGKIIIRGAYILNRSSGVNRIKGGSVQIN